jgi:hypothetical protein
MMAGPGDEECVYLRSKKCDDGCKNNNIIGGGGGG